MSSSQQEIAQVILIMPSGDPSPPLSDAARSALWEQQFSSARGKKLVILDPKPNTIYILPTCTAIIEHISVFAEKSSCPHQSQR